MNETITCDTCGRGVWITRFDHHKTWCNPQNKSIANRRRATTRACKALEESRKPRPLLRDSENMGKAERAAQLAAFADHAYAASEPDPFTDEKLWQMAVSYDRNELDGDAEGNR